MKGVTTLVSLLATVALVVVGVVTFAGTQKLLGGKRDVREIVLEAKNAAFSESHPKGEVKPEGPASAKREANPTIEARVGERLRIVVRNTDAGVLHSIMVPELSPEVRHVPWGREAVLEVTATAPGTYEYRCPQHCPLMKGKIVVRR